MGQSDTGNCDHRSYTVPLELLLGLSQAIVDLTKFDVACKVYTNGIAVFIGCGADATLVPAFARPALFMIIDSDHMITFYDDPTSPALTTSSLVDPELLPLIKSFIVV